MKQEHETTLCFDYEERLLRIYTTRLGVYNGILKRLGSKKDEAKIETRGDNSWFINIPLHLVRNPYTIVKVTKESMN